MGYTGGHTANPTYSLVCAGNTGHAEAVLVEFDPKVISYEKLLAVFWKNHSPTYVRKGQYRSAIFTYGDAQARIAEKSKAATEKHLGQGVATEIRPAERFWRAEEYHQQYFEKSDVDVCPSP